VAIIVDFRRARPAHIHLPLKYKGNPPMLHRTIAAALALAAIVLPASHAAAQDSGYPAVPLL
jgi:hypothetical protein